MGDTGATAVLDGELEITELVEFEPTRMDGVKSGATGFPFLILKAAAAPAVDDPAPEADVTAKGERPAWYPVASSLARLGAAGLSLPQTEQLWKAIAADGTVDEAPDIDGGNKVLAMMGQLIVAEAQELAAGHFEETMDIALLLEAMSAVKCWLSIERSNAMHAADDACGGCGCCPACYGVVMCSAAEKALLSAKERNDLPDSAFAQIDEGGKKDADGKTTPRSKRKFPIHDKAHADNAAARVAGGAEATSSAKRKIKAAQAKFAEAGAKSVVAEGATEVQTDHENDEAAAKAQASEERIETLETELAKARQDITGLDELVKSMPVLGGPPLSAAAARGAQNPAGAVDHAAKAAYYDDQAATASDPSDAAGYRQLAAREREQIPAL